MAGDYYALGGQFLRAVIQFYGTQEKLMDNYEPEVIKINGSDDLPKQDCWMVIFVPDRPWGSTDTPNGEHFWKTVHFQRGITKEQREQLSDDHPRKHSYSSNDVDGNNRVPWGFTEFGPGSFFGQEATHYFLLPTISEIPS